MEVSCYQRDGHPNYNDHSYDLRTQFAELDDVKKYIDDHFTINDETRKEYLDLLDPNKELNRLNCKKTTRQKVYKQ